MRPIAILGLFAAAIIGVVGFRTMVSDHDLIRPRFVLGETKEVVDDLRHGVFWLSTDTLVFVGQNDRPGQGGFDNRLDRAKIYIWRLGQTPRPYAVDRWPSMSGDGESYVCASNGKIAYSLSPVEVEKHVLSVKLDGTPIPPEQRVKVALSWREKIAEGPPGQETEKVRVVPRYTKSGELRFPINQEEDGLSSLRTKDCEDYTDDRKIGRIWARSADKKFYLDFGRQGRAGWDYVEGFSLESADGVRQQEFSGPFDHLRDYCVDTPSWEQSFVLYDCAHGWNDETRAEKFLSVYRVDAPSAKIIETRITNSETLWGADIARYKSGYVIAADAAPSSNSGKYQGLFLVGDQAEAGTPRRILHGVFGKPAVSPDGCRVAVFRAHRTPNKFRTLSTLVVVDLCKAEAQRRRGVG
jgi:hypothetical protein